MSRKSTTRKSSVLPPQATSNELNDSEGRLSIDDSLDPWEDMEKFETEQAGLIQGIIDEFSEKVNIDNGKKRKSSGKRRDPSRPMINKASSSSIGNGEIKKSIEREPIDKEPNNSEDLTIRKSSSISRNNHQPVGTDGPEAITMEERIKELIKANNELRQRLNSMKRDSSEPVMNEASSSSNEIGTIKKLVENEPLDKGMNKNSDNFEKSFSSTSSNDEQLIDESKVIIKGKKFDTAKRTMIHHPVGASNATSISEETARTKNFQLTSKAIEKPIEKKVASQISSIDRKSLVERGNIIDPLENNKAKSSVRGKKSQEIKQQKITSIVKLPLATDYDCKRHIELPLNKKIDKDTKNRRRKEEKLAKTFEKFGKKFSRVSNKMEYRETYKRDDSSSGSDTDESTESSSSSMSSSTSSTSSSYSTSTCCDCTDSSFGSSCSCSSCCTDDVFTEFTLTSSSDCEESDSSSSFSENDEKK